MTTTDTIFLPGFMCDDRLFAPQLSVFRDAGLTATVSDLTRHGTISEIAKNILATAPDHFSLTGLSMGGIVALEIYKQAPDRVMHLALLNSTPFADRSQAQRHDHIARVQQGEMLSIISDDLKPKYLAPANRSPEILRLVIKMAETLGEAAFVRQSFALLYRDSYLDLLPRINCPTLVLTGKQDNVCGSDIGDYMAKKIPNAKYIVLENCGHLSTLEQADIVTKHVAELIGLKLKETAGTNA